MTFRDPSTPATTTPRRFSPAVYVAGVAVVLAAFLLEIARGGCPVP